MTQPATHDTRQEATEAGWSVVELRQYTLHPGVGDAFVELFDRELVESQEAVGMDAVGQFRDLDNPDRFVWIRAYPDMEVRLKALTAFYLEGAVWKAHGPAAVGMMVDSTNALLLRPVRPGSGLSRPESIRPPVGAGAPSSRVVATIYYRDKPVDEEFVRFFEDRVSPVMVETGAIPLAYYETEPAENNFPRLPVRTGENVFVWFSLFAGPDHHRDHVERLARSKSWNENVLPGLLALLSSPPQQVRLAPTPRSWLR